MDIEKQSPPEQQHQTIQGPTIAQQEDAETQYPPLRQVLPIMLALYLAIFLVALDRTIIGTAIPRITDHFHSLGDVGWYGSAYLLTNCAFQLVFGRIYSFYSPKWVFLVAIGIFEIGSAICGAAPSSTALIAGRAIAGLGSCGIFSGTIVITAYIIPLRKRPLFIGLLGAIFGIASVAGPLLGGLFTDKVSWRWCFYINLPIGAVTIAVLTLLLQLEKPKEGGTSVKDQIAQLDPIGTALFLPAIICLILALQWGGSTYAWGNARIIVLLVLFVALIAAFIAVQLWKKERATIPPRIIRQRSIASGFWFIFCVYGSMMLFVYFVPMWFQAIKGVSAVKSGIMGLPMILGLVVASIACGGAVTALGYFTPFMYGLSILASIGAGLFTTFEQNTGHAKWIGYQVIYGFGVGMAMQASGMAAQATLSRKDMPTGAALMFFAQNLGGALAVSIGQNVFSSRLISGLAGIPNLDPSMVVKIGATDLRTIIAPEYMEAVLKAYNLALTKTFNVGLALACLSIIGAVAMPWVSVKGMKKGGGG